jgi:hypothetical protein
MAGCLQDDVGGGYALQDRYGENRSTLGGCRLAGSVRGRLRSQEQLLVHRLQQGYQVLLAQGGLVRDVKPASPHNAGIGIPCRSPQYAAPDCRLQHALLLSGWATDHHLLPDCVVGCTARHVQLAGASCGNMGPVPTLPLTVQSCQPGWQLAGNEGEPHPTEWSWFAPSSGGVSSFSVPLPITLFCSSSTGCLVLMV